MNNDSPQYGQNTIYQEIFFREAEICDFHDQTPVHENFFLQNFLADELRKPSSVFELHIQ